MIRHLGIKRIRAGRRHAVVATSDPAQPQRDRTAQTGSKKRLDRRCVHTPRHIEIVIAFHHVDSASISGPIRWMHALRSRKFNLA